jgi:hypothetical protein
VIVMQIAPTVEGFAVVNAGQIDVRTVSPTQRAAQVNWLFTHGFPVFNYETDEQIEAHWKRRKGAAEIVAVTIEVQQ